MRRLLVLALGALSVAAAPPPVKPGVLAAIKLVDLPGGTFFFGVREGEEHEQQAYPGRDVTVAPFRIGATTVTFDQYDAFARATRRPLPQDEGLGRGDRPVINVSRAEMLAFIGWLNAGTGRHFRLPSEAEFEYATRGGTTTPYYWGTAASNEYANLATNTGRDHWTTTAPVASFLPNAYGLYDMVGNVWQPVEDCRHASIAGVPLDGKPWVDPPCDSRIARGGWYGSFTRGSKVTSRVAYADGFRSIGMGFRLAEDMVKR